MLLNACALKISTFSFPLEFFECVTDIFVFLRSLKSVYTVMIQLTPEVHEQYQHARYCKNTLHHSGTKVSPDPPRWPSVCRTECQRRQQRRDALASCTGNDSSWSKRGSTGFRWPVYFTQSESCSHCSSLTNSEVCVITVCSFSSGAVALRFERHPRRTNTLLFSQWLNTVT